MHSKHQPKRLRYRFPIRMANLSWPEQQTRQILGVRDVMNPPTDNMGKQFDDVPENNKFHARWGDPGLLQAMVRPPLPLKIKYKRQMQGREAEQRDLCFKERLQYHFGNLCIQYGGRESTGVTWMKFYKGDYHKPNGLGDLKLVLFLHEYNDLEVEGSTFNDLNWQFTYRSDGNTAIKEESVATVQGPTFMKIKEEGEFKHVSDKDVDIKYENVTSVVDYSMPTAKITKTYKKIKTEIKHQDWSRPIKREEDQE